MVLTKADGGLELVIYKRERKKGEEGPDSGPVKEAEPIGLKN